MIRMIFALCLTVSLGSICGQAQNKLSSDLSKKPSTEIVDVIIQVNGAVTKQVIQSIGPYGQLKKVFDGINAFHMTMTASYAASLQLNPLVKYVSLSRPMQRMLD